MTTPQCSNHTAGRCASVDRLPRCTRQIRCLVRDFLERQIPRAPAPSASAFWPDPGLHAAWLGHSTVLLKIDGCHCPHRSGVQRACRDRPGTVHTRAEDGWWSRHWTWRELPQIDLVLLSHAHMDHFDIRSCGAWRTAAPPWSRPPARPTCCAPGATRRSTNSAGARARAVGPADGPRFPGESLGRAHAQRHVSRLQRLHHRGRPPSRAVRRRHRDDCVISASLKTSRPFDLAIMPVGAYNPWIHSHCTPEQAWQMAQRCGLRSSSCRFTTRLSA